MSNNLNKSIMNEFFMFWYVCGNNNLFVYTKNHTESLRKGTAMYEETINGLFTGVMYSQIELNYIVRDNHSCGTISAVIPEGLGVANKLQVIQP